MTIYRLQMQNEYDIIKIEEQPCERVAWPSFYREWGGAHEEQIQF